MAATRSSLVRSAIGAVSTSSPSRSTATSWQISKTSSRWCEMYRTATPPATSCRTRSNSRADGVALQRGGRLVQQHAAGRRAASARAISTICRCSTVRSRQGAPGSDVEAPVAHDLAGPGRASRRQLTRRPDRAGRRGRRSPRPTGRAPPSSAGRLSRSTRASGRRRRARRGLAAEAHLPGVRLERPDRIETSVDLPAPFRPTRPRHGPAAGRDQRRAARACCRTASRCRSPRRPVLIAWPSRQQTLGPSVIQPPAAALQTPPCAARTRCPTVASRRPASS